MNLLRHARWMAQAGHVVRILCLEDSPLHRAALAHIHFTRIIPLAAAAGHRRHARRSGIPADVAIGITHHTAGFDVQRASAAIAHLQTA